MAKRVSFKVHGRVQGVFFRRFTQEKANRYGLTGWVKNMSDGKVVNSVYTASLSSTLSSFNRD